MRHIRHTICVFCLLFPSLVALGQTGSEHPGTSEHRGTNTAPSTIGPSPVQSPAIVIGFVGGYVSHDNMVHSEVQLAALLRKEYPTGVYATAFENHRGAKARREILRLLDANRDGKLSAEEKQNARIILYGHSWGAAEAVTVARELGKDGIPVLLTIQVDSVAKFGEKDSLIPPNVEQAANFYQPHGWLRGRSEIRASDPKRTQILGNFRFDYTSNSLRCENYPWWDRYLTRAHTQIECDPNVWNQVEALIRAKLPPIAGGAAQAGAIKR
jgi:pimeloyl-ACP methyl ester carboxylesterase